MSFECSKRKINTFGSGENKSKRPRMISCSNSDSGRSSMSGSEYKVLSPISTSSIKPTICEWPQLSIVNKNQDLIPNGRSRRRFPDPIYDK